MSIIEHQEHWILNFRVLSEYRLFSGFILSTNWKVLKFIFYKKGAKISWLHDFLQILSRKIRAPGASRLWSLFLDLYLIGLQICNWIQNDTGRTSVKGATRKSYVKHVLQLRWLVVIMLWSLRQSFLKWIFPMSAVQRQCKYLVTRVRPHFCSKSAELRNSTWYWTAQFLGAVHKRRHQSRGGVGFAKIWFF